MKLGEGLRGVAPANDLVVEAAGGYRAVFALPEIDAATSDRVILESKPQRVRTLLVFSGLLESAVISAVLLRA